MTTERTLTFSDPDATARFASELAPLLGPGDEATVGALGEIAIRVALATEAGP